MDLLDLSIIVLCLLFLVKNFQAQNSENGLGTWYMYNGSHKVSKKYTLKTSAHIRFFELASEYQQEIYRLGINYRFNKKLNVTGGMVYSITDTSYKEDFNSLANLKRTSFATSFFDNCIKLLGCMGVRRNAIAPHLYISSGQTF